MGALTWQVLEALQTGTIEGWMGQRLFRCDPYLVWADATTSLSDSSQLDIAVLVELKDAGDFLPFLQRMNPDKPDLTRLRFLPNGFEEGGSRFITGNVDRPGLDALIQEVVEKRIERFSLQNSREDVASTARECWLDAGRMLQPEEVLEIFDAAKAAVHDVPAAAGDAGACAGTYLGIIDDGLPFVRVRNSVCVAGAPAAHLWDQGWRSTYLPAMEGKPPEPDDPYWQAPWDLVQVGPPEHGLLRFRGFLYGRRLRELAMRQPACGGGDRDEYFLSRYSAPSPRRTHGAAVLGLMAPWLSGARGAVDWPDHISGLAMVQLPTSTVLDTSGGSLALRVLDGLRYILWQEARDRAHGQKERPVVVNISYGVHAGPHDGSSMFERALAEMLERHPHLHVVLPAGNAAEAAGHARCTLAASGDDASAVLALEVLPDNSRESFVEIWIPKGEKVRIGIRAPGAAEPCWLEEGQAKIDFDPDPADASLPATVHFGVVYAQEVAQGTEASMALLAIAPTRRIPRPARLRALNQQLRRDCLATPGLWQVTLQNLGASSFTVDAWIERDDAAPDRAVGSRQARFVHPTPEGTLNGIASLRPQHDRLQVVGAMRVDGALSDYSAAGPARVQGLRDGPDVVAPADFSKSLPGLRTTGFVRGTVVRTNGTSAACAVFTRDLAERLGQSDRPVLMPMKGEPPPEMTCGGEREPQADAKFRGQDRRGRFSVEVDL